MESALAKHPDIAQRVGVYIASFALTETLLSGAFARMIGDDGRITHAIFNHFKNISDRVSVFRDVVDVTAHPASAELKPLLADVQNCSQTRNELAHGLFAGEAGGPVILLTQVTSKRTTKEIPISVEFLDAELAKISELNGKLKEIAFPVPWTGAD